MSGKVLFVSDTHFGCNRYSIVDQKTGLPTRLLDYKNSFSQIIDYAINNRVEAVIHSGDIFHRNTPTPTEQVLVLKEFQRLEDAMIKTYVINGNHDYNYSTGRAHATGVLRESPWKYVKIFDTPDVVDIFGIQFHLVPYPFTPKILTQDNCKKVVVCHAHFAGASIGAESFMIAGGVPETGALEGADIVISGHIHKRQEIQRSGYKIVYVGSMERSDFAERDEEKGFLLLDLQTLTYERMAIQTRGLVQFDFEDIHSIRFDRDIIDKVVKVKVKCKESEVKLIDLQNIRESLKMAHFIAAVDIEVEKEKRVRSATITEKITIDDAFKQYLDLKKPANREMIETLGMRIIQGVVNECSS